MMEMDFVDNKSHKDKGEGIDLELYREQIREIVESCVKLLVDKPESVEVSVFVGPKTTVYKISCAKENLGQVIGTQGKTIMGMRAVVHAMTARIGIRSIIEVPL